MFHRFLIFRRLWFHKLVFPASDHDVLESLSSFRCPISELTIQLQLSSERECLEMEAVSWGQRRKKMVIYGEAPTDVCFL